MPKQVNLIIKNFEPIFASQLRSNASGSSFHGKFQKGQATFVVNQTHGQERGAVIIPIEDLETLLIKYNDKDLYSKLLKTKADAEVMREKKNKERLEKMAQSFAKKYGNQQKPE